MLSRPSPHRIFAHRSRRRFVTRSAPPSARRPPHPEKGPTRHRGGPSSGWCCLCASASAAAAAARQSALPCIASSCRGRKPRSFWAEPTRSGGRPLLSSSRACWPAPNAIGIAWSMWMRRTSTRTRISATAGPSAGLVLRAVPLQRRPGAAVALPAGQRRTHDRCAAPAAGRGS